ncbi:MAG: 16S rRNA (cytosine(1402)-N(4))-methyltransferase RsmH [Actinobacteria bacterium]|nr:16S rRNA (cytosine(1402)-N(4))-methyltransferase RsmH [Actinomycetota bacterium]
MHYEHIPVLLAEVIEYLDCKDGDIIVDCTLGGGGHAEAILNKITPAGIVIGIDKDEAAINAAKIKLASFSQQIIFVKDDFVNIDKILTDLKIEEVDGILFDLGVSSFQLDEAVRGFGYKHDSELDMRMDQSSDFSASDVVNTYSEDKLTQVIKDYGEEKWASRIAKFIVEARKKSEIKTTSQLVDIIKAAIPASARRKGGNPARRTFQALRIEVNNELNIIEKAIIKAVDFLKAGRQLAIITYHSLEDRIAKNTLKKLSGKETGSAAPRIYRHEMESKIKLLTRKPIRPSPQEIIANPRSRSAKLRVAKRI